VPTVEDAITRCESTDEVAPERERVAVVDARGPATSVRTRAATRLPAKGAMSIVS
jgi:hypothetical protein